MKLVLASAGFYTPEIVSTCVKLVGKSKDQINIAVINEAYAVEHGDHGWVLDDLNRIKQNFTGRMELVNILALDLQTIMQRLRAADVIFVVGGHTDYLMHILRKTGVAQLLPQLLQSKVYVGSSAGSMILGKRVSSRAYQRLYGEQNTYGTTDYLELVDMAIKPHYNNPLFPNNNREVLLDLAKDYPGVIYGLADNTALVIDGDQQYIVGPQSLKIKNGLALEEA